MNNSSAKIKLGMVVVVAGVLPLLVSLAAHFLIGDAQYVQQPLHEAVELVGTCIAFAVAMLLLLRTRNEETSQHLFWVVASLVAMGLVDGLHGVHGISLRSWQRHGATLTGGVLFGLVWLPLPSVVMHRKGIFVVIVAGLALVLGLWLGAEGLPVTWDPVGLYTFPVKAANVIGGAGFLAAALFFGRRYLRQSHPEDLVFTSHTVLFGVASLLFSLSHTWAADWWATHGFRLLAYVVLLVAAYEMVVTLYQRIARYAQDMESDVKARTTDLRHANDVLQGQTAERERVEATLRENEERFRAIFDRSTVGKSLTSPEGKLMQVNKAFAAMLGLTIEELQRVSFATVTHPDDIAESRECIRSLLAKERTSYRMEKRYRHRDGHYVWTDVSTTLLRDPRDKPLYFITTISDITERKRAVDALHEANDSLERRVLERTTELERSKQLLDETGSLARVGGWELDLKRKQLSWTGVVKQIHEVGPEYQPTVETGINFYAPEAVPVISAAVRRAIEDGQSFDLELPLITAKGNRIWVHAIGQACRDDGEIVKIRGTFHDITERKHTEEALRTLNRDLTRRSAELEAVNHELEAFSYSVSHDLKAPLRSVDGFAQMLEEDYAARLDDEGRRLLHVVRDSARDMGQLINDLLTFSRLSRKDLKLVRIKMRDVAQDARRQVEHAVVNRAIRWEIGELPPAFGDEATLREVLVNLLSNAVKFTRPREEAVIGMDGRVEGDEVIYAVTDNGVGFDMAYKDKLFCVFQRLHTSAEFEGTGIGLALVQRIIQRHGGRVWAEGKVDGGATFHFTLPRRDERESKDGG